MIGPEIPDQIVWPAAILAAILLSAGVALLLTRARFAPLSVLRERFVLGVPWGSLIVLGLVTLVYLVVQDGRSDLANPVYLPFVNWSYLYPTGVFFGAFAHGSLGHIISNMVTALVLAPLAEYIYGHYPEDDPTRVEWPLRHQPLVRAFVIFPGTVLVVGLLSSIFAWGPVIGFSGVVFAFAGFTVIKYPIVTIVVLMARGAIVRVGDALYNPVVIAEVETTVSEPGWVGVSFQGHALGFLIGAVLAVMVLHRRRSDSAASPLRLWFGLIVIGIGLSMWAIWSSRGSETYVLYQGLGVALVFLAAALVVLAATASNRPMWGRLTRRQVAIGVLLIPLLTMSLIAIPMNVLTVAEHEPPEGTVTVDDYDVFYADRVDVQLTPAFDPFNGNQTSGTTNGVIVVSEDRHIWTRVTSSSALERDGATDVQLGGLGWRESVSIDRHGWTPVGNDTVYRVDLEESGETTTSFVARERTAELTIAGHRIGIGGDEGGFDVVVTGPDGEREVAPIPARNESVTVGEISIERDDDRLVATWEDTRVTVAERETG